MYMQAVVKEEAGYRSAIEGLAHSYKVPFEQAEDRARTLAFKDGGHNKFLESIIVWIDVRAPRYWWQEADTFRLSTKQSESTMHTLVKELEALANIGEDSQQWEDCAGRYQDENFEFGSIMEAQFSHLLNLVKGKYPLERIKSALPEGFLQTRMWCMSYKTLRNIILQRHAHKLPHWPEFIKQVLGQLIHPELLPTINGDRVTN